MEEKFGGNGADLPMLGVKQIADASDLFIGNHALPREKDSPSVPDVRRSGTRPSRRGFLPRVRGKDRGPGWPRSAHGPEARSGSHREKPEGKIYPSRGRAGASGIRAGGRDGPAALQGTADGGGWPRGAGSEELSHGNGGCNNAGPGHNAGRDKTPYRREESDRHADERLWSRLPAPVSRGSTGQPAPIMAG
jgi:hypothetical protein